MRTLALFISTLSVALATYLPSNSIYTGRLGQPRISRTSLVARTAVNPRQAFIASGQASLIGRRPTSFTTLSPNPTVRVRSRQASLNSRILDPFITLPPTGRVRLTRVRLNSLRGNSFISLPQMGVGATQSSLTNRVISPIQGLSPTIIRVGPGQRVGSRIITDPVGETSLLTAGASSRSGRMSTGRLFPSIADNNRRIYPTRQAFIGTINTLPNGELTVTPLSSARNSMGVGSNAAVFPSRLDEISGFDGISGINGIRAPGVQQQILNQLADNSQFIDF